MMPHASRSCFTFTLHAFALALLVASFGRCASTQTGPSGGLKDTIPPVLLKTTPAQGAVRFDGKKIVLTFDEYIALKDVAKNVVVSPPSLQRPVVQRRGKNIQVIFQDDTLRADRTYTVDFGGSLADNNEGNLYPPFRFVFSTGDIIDSMAFTGVLRDAYTMETLEGATVLLHETLTDSAVYTALPVAVARTDGWGYFSIQHIAPRLYRMYAIEDKNSNYRYDPGERIAFLDSAFMPAVTVAALPTITDATDTAALLQRPVERLLLAAKEIVGKQFLSEYPQTGKRQFNLVFNQRHPVILSLSLNGIDSTGYVIERNRFSDTLTCWITAPTLPDTLRGILNYLKTDSLNNLSPTEVPLRFMYKEPEEPADTKKKNDAEKPPAWKPKIDFNQQTGMTAGVTISFETLPTHIDADRLTLHKLNAEKKTRLPETFTWQPDSLSPRRFFIHAKWTTGTDYQLEILPEAFTEIYGQSNDSLVYKFTTPNPDKFCHIALTLSNVSSHYIIQVLDTKKERTLREVKTDKAEKILFEYLPAGEYCLRFINDENRNNIWDPGEVLPKKQPEKVAFLTLPDGKDILTLRENSEIEQDVDVAALFIWKAPTFPPPPNTDDHEMLPATLPNDKESKNE
ncbi:MAG: Ig-like domain-containing protein [Prevotellaceae bacterium]|jgi:hypothetical protein|nr:Ig-like domain-containing protein [Prevotellaceae bacterium]